MAIDEHSTGWEYSAFYLGYKDWIFEGIESFLSDGNVFGRTGERFIKTRNLAKEFVASFIPTKKNNEVTIFKPLEKFKENETPILIVYITLWVKWLSSIFASYRRFCQGIRT